MKMVTDVYIVAINAVQERREASFEEFKFPFLFHYQQASSFFFSPFIPLAFITQLFLLQTYNFEILKLFELFFFVCREEIAFG